MKVWNKIECVAIYTEDIKKSLILTSRNEVQWIRPPFHNYLGGYVAVMQAPDCFNRQIR